MTEENPIKSCAKLKVDTQLIAREQIHVELCSLKKSHGYYLLRRLPGALVDLENIFGFSKINARFSKIVHIIGWF
ncbi:Uncharacterised protein [Mycobacteroides abscessus subsp. massiliense]|nr:Uncharacterised protein [Mycobacteroides abscessus subsp. massiliense]